MIHVVPDRQERSKHLTPEAGCGIPQKPNGILEAFRADGLEKTPWVGMLERYSHVRKAAERDAVAGVTLRATRRNSEGVRVKVPVVERMGRIE